MRQPGIWIGGDYLTRFGAGAVTSVLLPMESGTAAEPQPWQTGLQEAASPVMEKVTDLNVLLTVIIVGITILVLPLIVFVLWRFTARRNPIPSNVTHSTRLEVLWTVTPVAILLEIDAIPGRLNETWIRIDKPGTYYGQCSELCGVGHAFMPIGVKAVAKDEFAAWVNSAREKVASRQADNVVRTEQAKLDRQGVRP